MLVLVVAAVLVWLRRREAAAVVVGRCAGCGGPVRASHIATGPDHPMGPGLLLCGEGCAYATLPPELIEAGRGELAARGQRPAGGPS